MNPLVVSTLALIGATSGLFGPDNPTICAKRTDLAGPCYQVHGRLELTDGSPGVRLWVIGTKRVLGVGTLEDDE